MSLANLLIRGVASSVFIVAGIGKLVDPYAFISTLRFLRLCTDCIRFAMHFSAAEITVGLLLLIPRIASPISQIAGLFFLLATGFRAGLALRSPSLECGCFGAAASFMPHDLGGLGSVAIAGLGIALLATPKSRSNFQPACTSPPAAIDQGDL